MRKLILTVLFVGCFAVATQAQNFDSIEQKAEPAQAAPTQAPPAQAAGDCQDDPRLETELMSLLQATEPINPPVTVTADTFINLDPDVLKALAGQMIICPNTPVLKSGKPARKVVADFEIIWDNIRKAAIANDEARVKELLTSYRAKPKPTEEIITLLAPIGLDDKTRQILYKTAGLQLAKEEGDSRLIDFYKVLGGRVADKTPVIITQSGSLKAEEKTNYKEKFGKIIEVIASEYTPYLNSYNSNALIIVSNRLNGVGCITEIVK